VFGGCIKSPFAASGSALTSYTTHTIPLFFGVQRPKKFLRQEDAC